MKPRIFSLKTEILLEFLILGSKLFHSIMMEKKRIFEKVMLFLNKGDIALGSGNIWCTFYRNEMKKVFWIFIFENFRKETKFPVPTTKLEGL